MPFDFSKLPWRQWLDALIRSGIWRIVMAVPWWVLFALMGLAMLALAWQK